jgi:hypothetical protein
MSYSAISSIDPIEDPDGKMRCHGATFDLQHDDKVQHAKGAGKRENYFAERSATADADTPSFIDCKKIIQQPGPGETFIRKPHW